MSLIDASVTGGSAAPCAVCGDATTLRLMIGDVHVPMCSRFCEHAWPNVWRLREALEEAREVLSLCSTRRFDAPEDEEVGRLGARFGYGAVMSAASKEWAKMFDGTPQSGSQHTTGPCERTVQRTIAAIDAALGSLPISKDPEVKP